MNVSEQIAKEAAAQHAFEYFTAVAAHDDPVMSMGAPWAHAHDEAKARIKDAYGLDDDKAERVLDMLAGSDGDQTVADAVQYCQDGLWGAREEYEDVLNKLVKDILSASGSDLGGLQRMVEQAIRDSGLIS